MATARLARVSVVAVRQVMESIESGRLGRAVRVEHVQIGVRFEGICLPGAGLTLVKISLDKRPAFGYRKVDEWAGAPKPG